MPESAEVMHPEFAAHFLIWFQHSRHLLLSYHLWCQSTSQHLFLHFHLQSEQQVKGVSPRVSVTNLLGSSDSGCTFYACDTDSGRSFIVYSAAQISASSSTAAARQCPNPGLVLRAVNSLPTDTLRICSLFLDIDLRRPFP
nr:unnamed protein product [Spirometra erinaceieuropaei]